MTNGITVNPWEGKIPEEIYELLADAMSDLPILARLRFVENILFSRGGLRGGHPHDASMVIAAEILGSAIRVLEANPAAAQLSHTPEPT
jgi:hypothetical protein